MRHYEVRDVMTADPVTVTPTTPVKDGRHPGQAAGWCAAGAHRAGRPVGVVTETDLLRKEQLQKDPDGRIQCT